MKPDAEAENILVEIRQNLRARAGAPATSDERRSRELLARLAADLSVLARAWDRLPPVASDRAGFAARLEVWLKRLARRASNWFTWEQINYNAAAADALRAAHDALAAQGRELSELRAQLDSLREELRARDAAELTAAGRDGE